MLIMASYNIKRAHIPYQHFVINSMVLKEKHKMIRIQLVVHPLDFLINI